MKLTQLKYFQLVCIHGTFSKAADVLFVSQPAVSTAVKELEEELGVVLFKRKNNILSLTKEGEIFLERVNHIIDYVDNTKKMMDELSNNRKMIRLGVPPMIGAFMFLDIYNYFEKVHPDIKIEIFESGSRQLRKIIESGEIDLGLAILDQISNTDFNTLSLLKTNLVFCVGKNHHFANKKSISMADLNNEKLIMLKQDSYQYGVLINEFEKNNVSPNIIFNCSQIHLIIEMLSYNEAGVFLFEPLADLYPNIVKIDLVESIQMNIGLLWHKNNQLSPYAKNFISFCKNKY